MSENNSRYAHFPWLCATACALGLTSIVLLFSTGLAMASGAHDGSGLSQDELDTKNHRAFITGGIFASASLFVGVTGCIPLPNFISKHITSSSNHLSVSEEAHDNQAFPLESGNLSDQPPSYASIVTYGAPGTSEDFPPPSYSSLFFGSTSPIGGEVSPTSNDSSENVVVDTLSSRVALFSQQNLSR